MKHGISLCLMLLLLSACGKPQDTEEAVLSKLFTSYVMGITYDIVCNGNTVKSQYDTSKPESAVLRGNEQVIAMRIGNLWHKTHPSGTVDQGVQFLINNQKKIAAKATAEFKKLGCNTPNAQSAAKAFNLYTHTLPPALNSMIDSEIVKQGGLVTPIEDIQATGKKL